MGIITSKKSRRVQRDVIRQLNYAECDKIVFFFIPGAKRVTGGTLQIFTLYRLTRDIFKDTKTDALICWIPGEGRDLHSYDGFDNEVTVFSLDMVLNTCGSECELLFHLPEYAAMRILEHIGWERLVVLREQHSLQINILNQNIEVMLERTHLDQIKKIFPDLTCTAGNPVWASESERRKLDIPIHALPTWYYPDDAPWQPYESKKNLMIVSPDSDPHRELVLKTIRCALPELEIQVIKGLKYEQYLKLERMAKWSLTFGEGLDGYFYGPVLRGGVAFAVRNGTFDLPGLENVATVYDSYKHMADRIVADIQALDSKAAYEGYNAMVRQPIASVLGRVRTSDALVAFYQGNLSLP